MALQTETNPNRDVLMNDSQILTFLQNDDVYLLGEPIMVYPEEDGSPECTIVEMGNLQSDNMNMRDIVLADHDYFRVDNINTSNFNTPYGSLDHEMSYGYVSEGEQVNEGLAVLEILYNNVQRDQPEFIDVNDLTETDNIEKTEYNDSYVVSDEGGDEDDVIFVAEYKQNGDSGSPNWSDGNAPRRNPVRKVRNSKASRDLELYEEDFAFLDHSEYIDDKVNNCQPRDPLFIDINMKDSYCAKLNSLIPKTIDEKILVDNIKRKSNIDSDRTYKYPYKNFMETLEICQRTNLNRKAKENLNYVTEEINESFFRRKKKLKVIYPKKSIDKTYKKKKNIKVIKACKKTVVPRLPKPQTRRNKPKKKYVIPKKNSHPIHQPVPPAKIPVSELKIVVNTTLSTVKQFLEAQLTCHLLPSSSRLIKYKIGYIVNTRTNQMCWFTSIPDDKSRQTKETREKFSELLQCQTLLYSIINNSSQSDVARILTTSSYI